MTHLQRKCKLGLKEHEIEAIILEAESTEPDEYTAFITECCEDIRIIERQVKQGSIGSED